MDGLNPILMTALALLLPFLWGYVFGSIPFGLIFTKMAGLGDVRAIGSGNIGATNVLRTGRKGLAAATLVADAAKGAVPVLLGQMVFSSSTMGPIIALGAFMGHLFPIWLNFKGGKGIAVFIGCLLAISPIAAIVFAIVWLATAALSRFSSLAALITTALTPIVLWYLYTSGQLPIGLHASVVFAAMGALAWYAHRANIGRLVSGTENKIGTKG